MAIRDVFKFSRKTFVNPSGWLDTNFLRMQNNVLWAALRGLFTKETQQRTESFEQAVQRLGLTEQDIQNVQTSYRHYALGLLLVGLILFCYAFFLLFYYKTFAGWLLGLAASALLFGQAFRYDFWAFQMKRRQLGASFAEWKRYVLGG